MINLKDYIDNYINEGIDESILQDPESALAISDDDLAEDLIKDWIKKNWDANSIKNITVRFDGKTRVVDIDGSLVHSKRGFVTNGAFVWGNVSGDFIYNVLNTEAQKVKSFEGLGFPRKVGGQFNLHDFKLVTDLVGCPEECGSFHIYGFTKMKSLKGCPTIVNDEFHVNSCNSIKELDYLPNRIGGSVYINYNYNLLSIEGLSDAVNDVVNGNLYINNNFKLQSLEGCPKFVKGNFSCEKAKVLTSLEGCPEQVGETFACKHCGERFKKSEVASRCQVGGAIDAWVR